MPPNVFGKSNSFLVSNTSHDVRGKESKTLQAGVFGSRGVKRTVAPFGQRNESMSNGISRKILRTQQTEGESRSFVVTDRTCDTTQMSDLGQIRRKPLVNHTSLKSSCSVLKKEAQPNWVKKAQVC